MGAIFKNRDDLREYILRKLGACLVKVELSKDQLEDAIDDSLDIFNQYLCKPVPRLESSRQGSVVIPLLPGDRGVIEVQMLRPQDNRVGSQMTIFELMYRMVFPRMPMGDWYALRSYYKMFQQIRGTEPDWYVDESTNTLYFDCMSGPYDIFYIVARDMDLDDFVNLKPAYSKMLKKYAVAEAKITLSNVRGKYGGSIPVPGGTLQTDAATMRQEGAKEKEEVEVLLEQMARFRTSPIIWG